MSKSLPSASTLRRSLKLHSLLRERELSKMHELLHGYNNRTCIVLHGLGDMGKTQLALEYIKQYKEKYITIF